MAQAPTSDAELLEIVSAIKKHGSVSAAARALGMADSTVRNRAAAAARRNIGGVVAGGPLPPGLNLRAASTHYTAVRDADGLPVIDPETGNPILHKTGEWVKTEVDRSRDVLIDALRDTFREFEGRHEPAPFQLTPADALATIYPREDLHWGLLAWGQESGQDFDLKIAQRVYAEAHDALVSAAPPSALAVHLINGDFFHTNNAEAISKRSGHHFDTDGRLEKVIEFGVWAEVAAIKRELERHETVEIVVLPGNHDEETALTLRWALRMYFDREPRVHVHMAPGLFWYRTWGLNFWAAHHGHKVKAQQMPGIMAAARPQDWGATKHRECFVGHLHHERTITDEQLGVRVRQLRAPVAKDAWHASHGYFSGRTLYAFTYHRERGLRSYLEEHL